VAACLPAGIAFNDDACSACRSRRPRTAGENMSRRRLRLPLAAAAIAAVLPLVSPPISAGLRFAEPSGPVVIDMASAGPSKRLAGANGVRVLFAPNLSVDCSPPRGCHARTQHIFYDFSCVGRYAIMVERVSMDINGNVVKHEVVPAAPPYALAYDAGAAEVLDTFCPLSDRG
jgi:hypothetical protein